MKQLLVGSALTRHFFIFRSLTHSSQSENSQQIDISYICICPVIDHEFCHNSVKVAVNPRDDGRVDLQTTLTML